MEEKKQNPFDMLLSTSDESYLWEKDLVYRNIQTYLQAKEISDMMVRVQKRDLQQTDFDLRETMYTGLFKEEQQNKNIFYFANKHFKEEKTLNSNIKYEQILKKCKRKKHLFWTKYSSIPPKTNDLLETKQQVNEVVRLYKMPTMAGFFGLSLAISFAMKLNLNPLSYRVAAILTGLGVGYVYSDFKNSDIIFNNLPVLKDQQAEKEKELIINYCFSVDPELMSKAFLTKYE